MAAMARVRVRVPHSRRIARPDSDRDTRPVLVFARRQSRNEEVPKQGQGGGAGTTSTE